MQLFRNTITVASFFHPRIFQNKTSQKSAHSYPIDFMHFSFSTL